MIPTTDWRERTEFLEKHALYMFSIDLNLSITAHDIAPVTKVPYDRIRAVLPASAELIAAFDGQASRGFASDTYHVLNDEIVTAVDAAVHEVPLAKVVDVQDWLEDIGGGVVRLDGRARLVTDDRAHISMLYGGVLRFGYSGAESLLKGDGAPEGSVQLITSYEADRPKYRWLTQAQLVGFGKVRTLPMVGKNRKLLNVSVDLYSAL